MYQKICSLTNSWTASEVETVVNHASPILYKAGSLYSREAGKARKHMPFPHFETLLEKLLLSIFRCDHSLFGLFYPDGKENPDAHHTELCPITFDFTSPNPGITFHTIQGDLTYFKAGEVEGFSTNIPSLEPLMVGVLPNFKFSKHLNTWRPSLTTDTLGDTAFLVRHQDSLKIIFQTDFSSPSDISHSALQEKARTLRQFSENLTPQEWSTFLTLSVGGRGSKIEVVCSDMVTQISQILSANVITKKSYQGMDPLLSSKRQALEALCDILSTMDLSTLDHETSSSLPKIATSVFALTNSTFFNPISYQALVLIGQTLYPREKIAALFSSTLQHQKRERTDFLIFLQMTLPFVTTLPREAECSVSSSSEASVPTVSLSILSWFRECLEVPSLRSHLVEKPEIYLDHLLAIRVIETEERISPTHTLAFFECVNSFVAFEASSDSHPMTDYLLHNGFPRTLSVLTANQNRHLLSSEDDHSDLESLLTALHLKFGFAQQLPEQEAGEGIITQLIARLIETPNERHLTSLCAALYALTFKPSAKLFSELEKLSNRLEMLESLHLASCIPALIAHIRFPSDAAAELFLEGHPEDNNSPSTPQKFFELFDKSLDVLLISTNPTHFSDLQFEISLKHFMWIQLLCKTPHFLKKLSDKPDVFIEKILALAPLEKDTISMPHLIPFLEILHCLVLFASHPNASQNLGHALSNNTSEFYDLLTDIRDKIDNGADASNPTLHSLFKHILGELASIHINNYTPMLPHQKET